MENAYKMYTKCAMEVYIPNLEDLRQNESETAVYGCHWPRDSILRMGRSVQLGERRSVERGVAGTRPDQYSGSSIN